MAAPINPGVGLANTIWSTNGSAIVATPDSMSNIPANEVLNDITPLSDSEITSLISNVTPGVSAVGLLGSTVSAIGSQVQSALAGAAGRLNAIDTLATVLSGNKAAMANLAGSDLSTLLSAAGLPTAISQQLGAGVAGVPGALSAQSLLGAASAAFPQVGFVVNDVTTIIKNPRALGAEGMIGIINQLANTAGLGNVASYFNYTAQLNVVKSVLSTVIGYGVPQLIDLVLDSVTSEEDRGKILLGNCMAAAAAGDAYTLSQLVQYVSAAQIGPNAPTLISVFLANYRYPTGTTTPNQSDANNLVTLLGELDPNWATYNRAGTIVKRLDNFTNINAAAKSQLMLTAYAPQALIGGAYQKSTLASIVKTQYPKIALPSN